MRLPGTNCRRSGQPSPADSRGPKRLVCFCRVLSQFLQKWGLLQASYPESPDPAARDRSPEAHRDTAAEPSGQRRSTRHPSFCPGGVSFQPHTARGGLARAGPVQPRPTPDLAPPSPQGNAGDHRQTPPFFGWLLELVGGGKGPRVSPVPAGRCPSPGQHFTSLSHAVFALEDLRLPRGRVW